MDKKRVKIAVVGAGHVAQIAHIPAYKINPDTELVALVDGDQVKGENVRKQFGFKSFYEDMTEMLDKEKVDAVDICTPNYLHAPMVIAALRSGRHVLCEKPLARNAAEAAQMVKVAAESKRYLMVGMNNRYRDDVKVLQTFIKRGELGQVHMVKTGWLRRVHEWRERTWFTEMGKAGGGALLDLGIPIMDLAIWVAGLKNPLRVTCSVFGKKGKSGVEESACAMVNFTGGTVLILEVSWNLKTPQDVTYLQVFGSKGAAVMHPLTIHKSMHGHLVNVTPELDKSRNYYKESYRQEINHFIECIQEKRTPLTTGEEAVSMMKILDAMYESAEIGKEIQLEM
jgi:predicted dehydrogenase